MKTWFSHIGCKVLIGLLAVQTFNLSIHSIDLYSSKTLTEVNEQTNYVDSFVKCILRNVLKLSRHASHTKWNTPGTSRSQSAPTVHLKWYAANYSIAYQPMVFSHSSDELPRNEALINLYFEEVPVKPPQA